MRSSKSDHFIYSIWVKLLVLYFIMFILSAVVPIAALFPNLGFPCYFNNLVDYSTMDLQQRNTIEHITPTLFLESPEMFAYLSFSFLADCCSMIYYFIGVCAVARHKKHVEGLTTLSNWVHMVGSPTIVYMGFLRLWTIQLFIHTLSYKHIYLAAFVYAAHFILSFIHIQCYISRNSPTWVVKTMEQHVPSGTMLDKVLVYFKPISTNLHLTCLALEMLVFSLSFMMAVGNSFYVMVSDIVFGSINLFLTLTIIWYIILEAFLVRYDRNLYGFYVGVILASIILLLPVIRYDKIFIAANQQRAIVINIVSIPVLAAVAAVVRLTRLLKGAKNPQPYQPIKMTTVGSDDEDRVLFDRPSGRVKFIRSENTDSDDDV